MSKVIRFIVCTLLVVLMGDSFLCAQGSTNDKDLSFTENTHTVKELLEEILPQHGVNISYSDDLMPLNKSIEMKSVTSISEVLQLICHNENLDFVLIDGQYLIKYYKRPLSEYTHTFYGIVEDVKSGEALLGATVYVKSVKSGIATNGYGFYSMTLPQGEYELVVTFIGYKTIYHSVTLKSNKRLNFKLEENLYQLNDVMIVGKQELDNPSQNILSSINRLDMEMAKQIPYIGEIDIFQSSLLLPGITNVGEGVSGVNVRGGTSDMNLIMLDEAVIYNSNHFFGLVSVFNPDAIKDVEILKGDFPAKYGGRNSSVMHVRQKEGNDKEFHLSGGIGLIASRLLAEGPALKGKANYLVSARSTFWGVVLKNLNNSTLANSRVSFQDINAKVKFNLNDKNKLYLSSYYGSDANKVGFDALKKWGNRIVSLRWNRITGSKHFMNLTSYFSQYEYRIIEESESAGFIGSSRIRDYAIKVDLTTYLSPINLFDYGAEVVLHHMSPGERIPGEDSAENLLILEDEIGVESSLYLSNERHFGNGIGVSIGMRYSSLYNVGKDPVYIYDETLPEITTNIEDTLSLGASSKLYHNLVPRVSIKYQLSPKSSFKLGHFVSVQYLHLLSNTISPSSADFWSISGRFIKPTVMNQTTLGFYKYLDRLDLDLSAELYYRKLENVIDYKSGADLLFNEAVEEDLLAGQERGYGVELLMKRQFGNLTGWLGYTVSKTERKVDGELESERINDGEYFPSNYDRTHDVSLTAIYQFSKNFSVSSNFVYYTGRPFSFPDSKYLVDGMTIPHFPKRNADRLSNYHRLDLAAKIKANKISKKGKKRVSDASWVFSIYNVYARRNAQAYFFRENETPGETPIVEKLSVLGSFIPSITFNFKF